MAAVPVTVPAAVGIKSMTRLQVVPEDKANAGELALS
jgi:hypothetical protein